MTNETNAKRILVPLAEGFEEVEAVAIIDVLRRADLEVITAGLAAGPITGSHGIALVPDVELSEVDPATLDAVVLPGGMPGTVHLMEDPRVLEIVRALANDGRLTAAICAAPRVLAAAGVTDGLRVTSHPSVRSMLEDAQVVDAPRVVRSGNVFTSQGPGTSLEFALEIVRELVGAERAEALGDAMLVQTAASA